MKRSLLIIAAALSLLLLLGTCILWLHSYRACDLIGRYRDGLSHPQIFSERGKIIVLRQSDRANRYYPATWTFQSSLPGDYYPFSTNGLQGFQLGGFGFWFDAGAGVRSRFLVLPHWAFTLVFAAMFASCVPLFAANKARRRHLHGQCASCGYDCRSSPDRCPECGRIRDTSDSPSGRSSGRIAGAFAIVIVCATIFLYRWSDPVRGAPAGRGANPEARIMFYPTWGGDGVDRGDRMNIGHDEWGNVWYQANWRSPEGDFLVIVQEGHAHMFYDFWSVVVLDRSMNVVRRGSVGLSQGTTPYRLVEVRTDDPAAPAVVRGKWRLSVGWKPPEHLGENDDAADSLQRIQAESLNPVEWSDDPEALNRNFISGVHDLRIRPARKGAE